MRLGFVRSYRLAVVSAALLAASCDNNPTNFDTKNTDRLEVNPTSMVIPGGRTAKLDVRAVNAGAAPTYADVAWSVTGCGDGASIDVAADPDQLDLQPPGKLIVTANAELGANCVDVSGGGISSTVDVVVTAEAVVIDSAPAVLRAGETGTVFPRVITTDSTSMTPFDLSHVVFASDAEDVATIDATGFVETEASGTALLSVTWVPDSTGITALAGTNTVRTTSTALDVVANVPASAALDVGSTFGAFAFPDSTTGEVVVFDVFGNVNTNPADILDITATSDNLPVATVAAQVEQTEDPLTGEISARAVMQVQVLSGGIANISGTVTTSTGVFAWGPASVVGAAPVIALVTPDNGTWADVATITGSGLLPPPGLVTTVKVDGLILGNITIVSDAEITAQMPTFATPGTYDVVVEVGGVPSNSASWTQNFAFNIKAFEPANEIPETAVVISVPAIYTGTFADGAVTGDLYDFVRYTMSSDVAVRYTIDWSPDKDLDGIEFTCFDSANVFTFACFSGVFIDPHGGTALGAGAAADWLWVMNDFDAEVNGTPTAVVYTVEIVVEE